MESIRVEHLTKRFGKTLAVDDISFSVAVGEFFGFLGPNGAGKTTTINVLCTLLRPTSGHVIVNGYDVQRQPDAVRRSIGLVFQESTLDDRLTAMENLEFHARVYNVPTPTWRVQAEQLLRVVELWDRRNELVRSFSGGMRRRLEIARGLLHHPGVLFLDEPTIGLDPQTRDHIWQHLLALHEQEGVTLFLTTHYMEETERCDRIAIIDHGRIIALDSPERLKERVGGDIITLETPQPQQARERIHSRFGLEALQVGNQLRIEAAEGEHLVPRLIADLGVPVESISLRQPTLDDVFLKLTGTAIREASASGMESPRARVRLGTRGR
ncbi:MAG: ATP-binding cassette domain-containing protein [Ktedonobacterales bacterium]